MASGQRSISVRLYSDSVKDSQLSYGGLRDPGSARLGFPGTVWGGVIANQGNVQSGRGDAQSGFYAGVGGQYLTGVNVVENWRIDGSGGAYWRVKTWPESGNVSIGANFFGMHYAHNLQAYTFGMGSYFAPGLSWPISRHLGGTYRDAAALRDSDRAGRAGFPAGCDTAVPAGRPEVA